MIQRIGAPRDLANEDVELVDDPVDRGVLSVPFVLPSGERVAPREVLERVGLAVRRGRRERPEQQSLHEELGDDPASARAECASDHDL